jgi:tetratricopeptide repeat protein 8
MAFTCEKIGDIQRSYQNCKKSLDVFTDHTDSKELIKQLKQHFEAL